MNSKPRWPTGAASPAATAAAALKRVRSIEDDMAFLALMNRALLEVVLKAGLCDPDEFTALLEAIDAADGVSGDGIDVDDLKADVGMQEEEVDKAKLFRETFQASLKGRRRKKR